MSPNDPVASYVASAEILERLRIGLTPFIRDVMNSKYPNMPLQSLKRYAEDPELKEAPDPYSHMDIRALLNLMSTNPKQTGPGRTKSDPDLRSHFKSIFGLQQKDFDSSISRIKGYRNDTAHANSAAKQMTPDKAIDLAERAAEWLQAIPANYRNAKLQLEEIEAIKQRLSPNPEEIRPRFWLARQDPQVHQIQIQSRRVPTDLLPPMIDSSESSSPDQAAALHYQKGRRLTIDQEPAAAVDEFSQAIRIYPEYIDAYVQRALLNIQLEQHEAAITDLNTLAKFYPRNAGIYTHRGRQRAKLGECQSAIADFTKALELEPNNSTICLERAYAYNMTEQPEQVLDDVNRVIRLDPGQPHAYSLRGSILLLHERRYEAAIADLSHALSLFTDQASSIFTLLNRSVAYYYLEKYQPAITDLNQIIKLEPALAVPYINRAAIHWVLKQYPAVVADLTAAIEIEPSRHRYLDRAEAYELWSKQSSRTEQEQLETACLEDLTRVDEYDAAVSD